MLKKYHITSKNSKKYILTFIVYDEKVKKMLLKQLSKNKQLNVIEVLDEEE